MTKRRQQWERVAEPSSGLTHFDAPGQTGNATLCGIADWLGSPAGEYTEEPCTCQGCLAVVRFVLGRRSPPELKQRAETSRLPLDNPYAPGYYGSVEVAQDA